MSLDNGGIVKKKVKVGYCTQLSDGRYLSASDSDFLEIVSEDVYFFLEKGISESVLVFPPFNNFHRFLIHQLVENNYEELSTFSIGEHNGRRTVVCYREKLNRKVLSDRSTCVRITTSMGVENQRNTNEDQNSQVASKCSGRKKARTIPDVALYRPPALRKTEDGATGCSLNDKNIKPRQRRPDIAVYVPRPLRGVKDAKKDLPTQAIMKHLAMTSPSSEANGPSRTQTFPTSNAVSLPSMNPLTPKSNPVGKRGPDEVTSIGDSSYSSCGTSLSPEITSSQLKVQANTLMHLNPDEASHDQVVFNTLGSSFSSSPPTSRVDLSSVNRKSDVSDEQLESDPSHCGISCKSISDDVESCKKYQGNGVTLTSEGKLNASAEKEKKTESEHLHGKSVVISEEKLQSHNAASVTITAANCGTASSSQPKTGDCEESKKSTDKNRFCSFKNTHVNAECKDSNINASMEVDASMDDNDLKTLNPSKSKERFGTKKKSEQVVDIVPRIDTIDVQSLMESQGDGNESEENEAPLANWEDLFDLPSQEDEAPARAKPDGNKKVEQSRKLLDEVVTAVGKVSFVNKPRSDYSQYRTDNGHHLAELTHVVEVYGFPAEFKTHDLISVLSPYGGGNSGAPAFEIKWVDDTHALAVFASSFVAADVLHLQHPLVKTRALDNACAASKAKARKTCESLKIPFRPRPETCAALAQRLITGALGVHHRQSKAEREEERRLLREAREKRRSAARERDAAWEGTIGGSAL